MAESQRRITPEIMKAETALVKMDAAANESMRALHLRWLNKRRRLIAGWPVEVAQALVAVGVITGDQVQDAAEFVQGGP